MKIKPYGVCDICGDLIKSRNTKNRLVIKRRFVWGGWDEIEYGYNRIDLCPECQEKMFEWIKLERSK